MAVQTPLYALQNASHPAKTFRQATGWAVTGEGVLGATHLQVTANSTPAMNVDVATGYCWIDGDSAADQGFYFGYNDATTNLAISAADGSNPRIDIVVAQVNDSAYSGSTDNWELKVITGTPAGSPAVPTLPSTALKLAQIAVGAGVTTITSGNITDSRTYAATTLPGAVTVGSDGKGHDVTFYSDTAGDSMVWDSSAESLTITGTNGANALVVADGNVSITDNLDVDGTTNLDAVDIDGAVQIDSTVTVGVNDTGYDVKFFGATDGAYMEWDESEDHLNVNGQVYIGSSIADIANLPDISLAIGSNSDVTPSGTMWDGHFTIDGNGYKAGISLDGDAMWLGHDSSSRSIYFAIDAVHYCGLDSDGRFILFGGHDFTIKSSRSTGREILEFRTGTSLTSGAGYNMYGDADTSHPSKHIFFCDSSSSELLIQSTGVTISGSLSKGSGSFNIPHPTKGGDWRLRHSFIEGPTCDNIYRGTVTLGSGAKTIDLDTVSGMTSGTWEALNTNPWSSVASSGNAVTWSLSGKTLTINGPSGAVCNWMVIGERKDPTIIASDISDSDGKLIVEYEDPNYTVTVEEEE